MKLTRRQFMLMGTSFLSGCALAGVGNDNGPKSLTGEEAIIYAGPSDDFREEGVYDRFRSRGFFLIRHGGRLSALSSICPHRRCTLNVALNGSFICPCHGSTFDPDGTVTRGPARRDLSLPPIRIDSRGGVWVRVSPG